jgi:hypothetical protein
MVVGVDAIIIDTIDIIIVDTAIVAVIARAGTRRRTWVFSS